MGNYKKELLKMIEKLGDNKNFWKRVQAETSFSNREVKIGSSNIRSVSNICENADCYEELKLYIEYKIAKDNGWNSSFDGKRSFGQVVLEDMDKIYKDSNCNDREALKRIGLYFGYLYWKKSSIEKGNN